MRMNLRFKWQGFGILLLALLSLSTMLISVTVTAPVLAQSETGPTPTPNDPLWRAFNAARAAVEEERNVDLSLVQRYTFEQEEYVHGIDWECDEDVVSVDVRPVYFGWTFRITDLGGTTHQVRVSFDLRAVAVCDHVTESGAVPVTTGTPNPNLPAPVAGSGATGAFELGGQVQIGTLTGSTITYMQQAGMTWVKMQLRYNLGDSAGGNATAYIQDAHSKGFKIMLSIAGHSNQMGDTTTAAFDTYINQFADFCGQVAAAGADAIEVWNEPNLDREWPNGQIHGANYTRLLAAAFNRIKAARSSTIVISAAPSPTGAEAAFPGAVVNDDTFMRQMAEAGAANYLDCLGLHYNEGIVAPNATTGDPRDAYPTRYFGSMLQRGLQFFSNRPVCWTELGYLTPEGYAESLPAFFAWGANTTVAQQAAWLAQAATLSAQSGRVRLMIVWNVNFQGIATDPMGGYAMIRPNGSCPACAQLGTVMH